MVEKWNEEFSPEEAASLNIPQYSGKKRQEFYDAVVSFLPDDPCFILTLRDNKRKFVAPIRMSFLRYSPTLMETIYPSSILGDWKVIACMPAKAPSPKDTHRSTPPVFLNVLAETYMSRSEIARSQGFPDERLIPILVYRDFRVDEK